MWEPFIVRALVAGTAVAAIAGPLGCFVVWRRMSFFGDALAHSALLGVALGLLLSVHLNLAVALACVLIAVALFFLEQQNRLSLDTLLGIVAHSALALGLLTVSLIENVRFDLMTFLFGDILAVSNSDVGWMIAAAGVVAGVLVAIWRALLAITVHPDLAAAEGVAVKPVRLAFMVLMATTVAIGMKVVGILLITSLLIIPAAGARRFANTPEQMAFGACLIGVLSVAGGIGLSLSADAPTGPSIVVVATLFFAVSECIGLLRRRTR
ncbi:MAG: zinc ABC transporter permease subunit ZnuB [Gammaproteobacteria bacterium]|nr:zinc ABC transporter permease subunit ZnuB [Gammaproteobacteria bacterium]